MNTQVFYDLGRNTFKPYPEAILIESSNDEIYTETSSTHWRHISIVNNRYETNKNGSVFKFKKGVYEVEVVGTAYPKSTDVENPISTLSVVFYISAFNQVILFYEENYKEFVKISERYIYQTTGVYRYTINILKDFTIQFKHNVQLFIGIAGYMVGGALESNPHYGHNTDMKVIYEVLK